MKHQTRREFLLSATQAAAATAAGVAFSPGYGSAVPEPGQASATSRPLVRPKVALVGTVVRKLSHAQHFLDRLLEGYGWQGQHHQPAIELVSMYIDQFPNADLARERGKRHNVPIYPTIGEALTLGGSKLAVDGVIIIGEHGEYPKNELGQTLYPRFEFFKQCVKVFENSGRAVPVFNDKHLSTDWNHCVEMVADSKRLGFPFLAGSSLPVTWRIPSIELPIDTPLEESVSLCYGGVDSYDFHGLEAAQCMSERRPGGEVGIKSVLAARGARVCDLLDQRPATRRLVFAALARSHTVVGPKGYTFSLPDMPWLRQHSASLVGYFIEHLDGFKTSTIMMNGLLTDFTYAGSIRGSDRIVSCQMYLPMPPANTTLADFFNPLMNNIEQMILNHKAPYPVERTLLTSGMTLAAMTSLHRGEPVQTPEMNIAYRPATEPSFWRA